MITPFPLLAKELTEQAARRRTFALRSLYALMLFGVFVISYTSHSDDADQGGLGMLGKGRGLFDALVAIQCWLITLVMPAMAAGAITAEKESGTLVLLMLTDLGPWELLLQKWLSRIIAVGSLVLASIPLLALAYAFGGIPIDYLVFGAYAILLSILQTSAFALALSCVFKNSATALIATYALLAACFVVSHNELLLRYTNPNVGRASLHEYLVLLQPLRLFQEEGYRNASGAPLGFGFASSTAILLSTMASLLVARLSILRDPQPTGMSPLLRLFRMLDRWFERADAAIGRRRSHHHLPVSDPVAWREFNRRSFSNWRYLLRLVLPLHIILLALLIMMIHANVFIGMNHDDLPATIFVALLGAMTLFLMILASGLFARERSDQTLDVLLTTPMTGREILAQKAASLRRIHVALASVPGVMVLCVWLAGASVTRAWAVALLLIVLTVLVLPAVFTWMAVWFGLRIRNRLRAISAALLASVLWLGGGVIERMFAAKFLEFSGQPWRSYRMPFGYFDWDASWFECCLSPLTALCAIVHGGWEDIQAKVIASLTWYALVWLWLRWRCLKGADRLLAPSVR